MTDEPVTPDPIDPVAPEKEPAAVVEEPVERAVGVGGTTPYKGESEPAGAADAKDSPAALDDHIVAIAAELAADQSPETSLDYRRVAGLAVKAVVGDGDDELVGRVLTVVRASPFRDDPNIAARIAVQTAARLSA